MSFNLKSIVKKILLSCSLDPRKLFQQVGAWSLSKAARQQGLVDTLQQLRAVVPDISNQESSEEADFCEYLEIKRRLLHAYQVKTMTHLLAENEFDKHHIRIVDIGDSAGTHCLYFKQLLCSFYDVSTLSVNLDPRAIAKIKARGLPVMLKRAEEIANEDLGGDVDIFTSFEMIEHLHNPALFLHRLSKSPTGKCLFITVPFLRNSRVGLHHIRNRAANNNVYAEDVHVFELSPADWTLLFRHAGWRVVNQGICYQYPRHWPLISRALRAYWTKFDFEGFWGAELVRDITYESRYQDWED